MPEVGCGVCLWVMPCCDAWAVVECRILHLRVITVVQQLLGATVQGQSSVNRLGVCRECRPAAHTTHNPRHTPYVSEAFSTLWLWLQLHWGKTVQVLSCRHIQGSVHPKLGKGRLKAVAPVWTWAVTHLSYIWMSEMDELGILQAQKWAYHHQIICEKRWGTVLKTLRTGLGTSP